MSSNLSLDLITRKPEMRLTLLSTYTPAYSDTDSDWSSLDGRQRTVESYCKVNRKQTPHKRIRKKRVIPVPTPRVPPTHPLGGLDAAGVLNYQGQEGGCETIDK
ncbi:unnamed protein product, partial [Timema podura]|nr:unnamed protein product [Timema podura]